jgi:hypothetical protein
MTTVIGIHSAVFWGQIQSVNKLDEYSYNVWIEQYVVLDMVYSTERFAGISHTRWTASLCQAVLSVRPILCLTLARMIAQASSPLRTTSWDSFWLRSRDSSVGIVTGWAAEVRFPAGTRGFSRLHSVQTGWGSPSLCNSYRERFRRAAD